MAETTEDDEFNSQSNKFIDWLKHHGTPISQKIELADLRHRSAGRGVLAGEDIADDEELFSIPRTSILTVDTSSLPDDIKQKLDDPWLSLIIAMIYEDQKGTKSKWKAYFDILPETFDTLMYWSEKELDMLRGSAVVNKIGKEGANKMFYEQVIPVIRQREAAFQASELADDELLALCHRMGSTIMAYAFDLESSANTEEDGWEEDSDSGEVQPKGMVPLADMLNADADRNNAKLFYEDDKVVMKAIKAIKKGEELFNDYGPLPRADVLRRYGYVTDNYAKYDVVEMSLGMIKETAKEEMKISDNDVKTRLEYLDEQGALDDGYVIFRSSYDDGPFSDELRTLLNVLATPKAEYDRLRKKHKLPKPELSQDALRLLSGILLRRRALYALRDDSADQHRTSVNKTFDRRRIMAMQIIDGEKEVLDEAAKTIDALLDHDKKQKGDNFEDKATNLQKPSKKARNENVR